MSIVRNKTVTTNRHPQERMPQKWEQEWISTSNAENSVMIKRSGKPGYNSNNASGTTMKKTMEDLSQLKLAAAAATGSHRQGQQNSSKRQSSAGPKKGIANVEEQREPFVSGPAEHMCRVAGNEASRCGKDFEKNSTLAQHTRKVAELRWSDLNLGKLLGTGAFCHVYEANLKPRTPPFPSPVTSEKRQQDTDELLEDDSNDIWDLLNGSGIDADASLGAGGSNHNIQNSFAIKQLDPHFLEGKHDFADCAIDLVMEAKILACLIHPNIIKLHAVSAGSISRVFTNKRGGYFLLLDRLHGGSLTDRIREWADGGITASRHDRAKLLEDRLKSVALGISEGMKYLHKNMVIYRDLKPSNIGFNHAREVKLYDFGLAREMLEDGRKMTGYTGSARYMAPEVARSDYYDLSADVYSFGILLWELCSLQKAFPGMTKEEHIEFVVGSQVRPKLSAIEGSSSLKKLIQACWSHESRKRPSFSDIRDQLCFDLDLPDAPNAASNTNRFMRLRKQRSERRMGKTLASLFHKES